MAQGRLAKILENEYKSKGIASGVMSAIGKRGLEIADPRNYLFGGSGLGSIIGRKIFGRGYSGTRTSNIINNNNISALGPAPSTGLSDESVALLRSMKADTAITAKSAIVLPAMARDMNLARQNIAKLVLKSGESPAYKADMFFKRAQQREDMYESQFRKNNKGSPTQISSPQKDNNSSPIVFLSALATGLSKAVTGVSTAIAKSIESLGKFVLDGLNGIRTALGLAKITSLAPTLFKMATSLPAVVATTAVAGVAAIVDDKLEKEGFNSRFRQRKYMRAKGRPEQLAGSYDEVKFQNQYSKYHSSFSDSDTDPEKVDNYNNTPSQIKPMTSGGPSGLVGTEPEQINQLSPEKVGSSEDQLAKMQAEEYLGRAMSPADWDHLKKAVYAESTKNVEEYAHVMAVILNRARKSGKDVTGVLMEDNAFQSVTGTAKDRNPSPMFQKGPQGSALGPLLESAGKLSKVSKNLDSFTAANLKAYKAGTTTKWLDKLMASGGRKIGGTIFAENMYGPRRVSKKNTKGAQIQELSTKQMNPGSSGTTVNLNKVDNSVRTTSSGSSGKIADATNRDMLDILFIK